MKPFFYYDTLIIEFEAPDDGKFIVRFPAETTKSCPKSITATALFESELL
jgi:hypothetical protein